MKIFMSPITSQGFGQLTASGMAQREVQRKQVSDQVRSPALSLMATARAPSVSSAVHRPAKEEGTTDQSD